MTDAFDRLNTTLADRYTIKRELGAGGMGPRMHTETGGFTQMISDE